MEVGEKLLATLKVYWSPSDLMPHHFSVVVYAEKSPVRIVLDGGGESKYFPTYKLSENVTRLSNNITPDSDASDQNDDTSSKDDLAKNCGDEILDDDCFYVIHTNETSAAQFEEVF